MYIATAASAYGLDYYQALLAEPEDDILKPKRTLATQKSIAIARKHWRKFCQEIFPKSLDAEVDPIERLHHVYFRDLQVYFRWYLQHKKIRKVKSILSRINDWSMMYRDDMGRNTE